MKISPAFKLLVHCYVDYYKVTMNEKISKIKRANK